MGDEKTTISAYIDEENAEWLDEADVNKSQLINELLSEKRMHRSEDREEILERKIEDKKNEIAEQKNELRELEQELANLEAELESVREKKSAQVEEVIEQLGRATVVPADERGPDAYQSYAEECGMMPDEFADLVDHIDLHSLKPSWKWDDQRDEERIQEMLKGKYLYEENLVPADLREVAEDADNTYVALQTLTDEQEELAREWLDSRD